MLVKGGTHSDKLVLIGYDELDPSCVDEATQWLTEQLTGATIRVEVDTKRRDSHENLLAYVYMPDGTLLNSLVFAKGYARISMFDGMSY